MKVITLMYVIGDDNDSFPEIAGMTPDRIAYNLREGYTVMHDVRSCLNKDELVDVTVVDLGGEFPDTNM